MGTVGTILLRPLTRLLQALSTDVRAYTHVHTCASTVTQITKSHVVVPLLSHVPLSVTPWNGTRQPSLSFTVPWSLLKLISTESVMSSNHLVLCCPFSCLQPCPVSGSLRMSQLFASGGRSVGASASASVLPMNSQD